MRCPQLPVVVLLASVLSVSLASVGCGSAVATKVACPTGDANRYAGFSLGPAFDGIEMRELNGTKLNPIGTVCGNAKDKKTCLETVSALKSSSGWSSAWMNPALKPTTPVGDYGVGTKGDLVFLVTSREAFAKAVAPIDEVEAVALVQLTKDGGVLCNEDNVAKVEGGFSVRAFAGECQGNADIYYHVTADGVISETSRETNPDSKDCR